MRGRIWFWLFAGVVLVASPGLLGIGARADLDLVLAAAAAVVVASVAVAGVAGVRYRDTRDTHDLFVAMGFGVIAVQSAVFSFWYAWKSDVPGWFAVTLSTSNYRAYSVLPGARPAIEASLCWLLGVLVAASCFLVARPWWDRRGRPPVRPWRVLALVGAVLLVGDLIIVRLSDGSVNARELGSGFGALGALGLGGWLLGIAAGTLLLAAASRETAARETGLPRPWFAAAFLVLVPAVIAQLLRPTVGSAWVQWADVLPVVVAGLALGGVLAEQRLAATRMRRASDLAEEIMTGRAEIASMIAHEVRGPASAIKGLAATISKSYERLSDEDRLEFAGLIEAESQLLLETVDQTALALKVDAGTLAMDRRPHDVATVVREGAHAADARGHELELDLTEDITAEVDRRWLGELVRQLVDNAAKFSPAGAPIRVSLAATQSDILIEVVDRGPGIPEERRAAVFERFSRWRPPGYEDLEGSGLGLFICRGLAAEHQGEVSVGDGPDAGTMLRVRLPIDAAEGQRGR